MGVFVPLRSDSTSGACVGVPSRDIESGSVTRSSKLGRSRYKGSSPFDAEGFREAAILCCCSFWEGRMSPESSSRLSEDLLLSPVDIDGTGSWSGT